MVSRRKRKTRSSKVPRRNAVAKALAQRRYRQRVVPGKRDRVCVAVALDSWIRREAAGECE